MARTVAQPQPAQMGETLARLVRSVSDGFGNAGFAEEIAQRSMRRKARSMDSKREEISRSERSGNLRPWLMETVSWGGVGLSALLAGVGVIGLVGFESPLAKIGSFVLLGGTVLTEVAAARLPVHAERRFREGGASGVLKGCAVTGGFLALTAWNVIAGHFGMVAIDAASVADVRQPLQERAAAADARRETAEEALAAYDAETRLQSEQMGLALRGAFQSGYVTAAGRSASAASAARAEQRVDLAQAVTDARGEDRAAEAALEAAAAPRPDHELWTFALILELLKGALVWFATASERRLSGTKKSLLSPANSDPRSMSAAERRELKSRCASILATIRHMEAARG